MKGNWLIIPEIDRLDESVSLAEEYDAAFEYNDFFLPEVYQSKEKTRRIINTYQALDRDRSSDTLHGAFLDLAPSSMDSVIREYSRELMEQSMEIAQALGVHGVVFHSGLVAGVETPQYIENWLCCMEEIFREFAKNYPRIGIYLENTVERVPEYHVALMKHISNVKNIGLCLDYAHAVLAASFPEEWVKAFEPYVKHIHVNDNDLLSDQHAVPGEGKIDFTVFRENLEKYRIDVPILLELRGIENQKRALEYMTSL